MVIGGSERETRRQVIIGARDQAMVLPSSDSVPLRVT